MTSLTCIKSIVRELSSAILSETYVRSYHSEYRQFKISLLQILLDYYWYSRNRRAFEYRMATRWVLVDGYDPGTPF